MAHWITHLRIAQGLCERTGLRSRERFILGNIAPDSGEPLPDGKGYEPDGSVTHFRSLGEHGDKQYHEERFIEQYFNPSLRADYGADAYAFFLGYLTHLLTDKLWRRDIVPAARKKLASLYEADHDAFVRKVNGDWAQLDFSYLKAHPEFDAWKTYLNMADLRNVYVEFYDEGAFVRLRDRQIPYYQKALSEFTERETYLTGADLSAFIGQACDHIRAACGPYFEELMALERKEETT